MSSAWAAGNGVAPPANEPIEEIVVKAKRPAPEAMDEIVIVAKRLPKTDAARTPPAMPIDAPRLEFSIASPPVVRL
jgi:hypothetical protein